MISLYREVRLNFQYGDADIGNYHHKICLARDPCAVISYVEAVQHRPISRAGIVPQSTKAFLLTRRRPLWADERKHYCHRSCSIGKTAPILLELTIWFSS